MREPDGNLLAPRADEVRKWMQNAESEDEGLAARTVYVLGDLALRLLDRRTCADD